MSLEDIVESTAAELARKKASKRASNNNGEPVAYEMPETLPDYWYQAAGQKWWARNDDSHFVEYPTSHIRALLLEAGIRGSVLPGERLSPVDLHLLHLRRKQVVQWAGELAGFNRGVQEICGSKILVTRGPKLIKAKKGAWPLLQKFLGELLGDDLVWLYGWLKSSLRSMYAGAPFRKGQALALAGPSGCGKSLLQSIITEIFGGRDGRPWQYLMGETGFNEDLLSREHLMIEDEAASTDIRKRIFFGVQLKNLIANDTIRCHPKGTKGMYLQAFWRVTITVNDEPECLMVMPPIGEDLKDKIILLKAFHATMPYGLDDLAGRRKFRESLSQELPAFINFLHSWPIPAKMRHVRYGIRAYQNEELLHALQDLQPEFRLLELIKTLSIWDIDAKHWRGTASKLQDHMEAKDQTGKVRDLLRHHSSCGTYLSKLSKHFPDKVKKIGTLEGKTLWLIPKW